METFLFLWIFFIHWTSFNNNQPPKYRWLLQSHWINLSMNDYMLTLLLLVWRLKGGQQKWTSSIGMSSSPEIRPTTSFPHRTESIPIKEQCVFVCLLVCLLFIGHTRFPTLRCCLRVREQEPSRAGGPARAGKHAQREHACACRTKNRSADAFQKQNRTRAHAVVPVSAEIFKKREKENQHATSQVQFTVRLLLECLLFE